MTIERLGQVRRGDSAVLDQEEYGFIDRLLSAAALKKALKWGLAGFIIGCVPLVPNVLWIPAAVFGLIRGAGDDENMRRGGADMSENR